MTFYSDLASTVTALLVKRGVPVILERETKTGSNPVAGTVTTSPSSLNTTGVHQAITVTLKDKFTLLQAGDMACTLSPDVAPIIGDVVNRDSERWTVVEIVTIKPADVVLAYLVLLRR